MLMSRERHCPRGAVVIPAAPSTFAKDYSTYFYVKKERPPEATCREIDRRPLIYSAWLEAFGIGNPSSRIPSR